MRLYIYICILLSPQLNTIVFFLVSLIVLLLSVILFIIIIFIKVAHVRQVYGHFILRLGLMLLLITLSLVHVCKHY